MVGTGELEQGWWQMVTVGLDGAVRSSRVAWSKQRSTMKKTISVVGGRKVADGLYAGSS